jgi:hypothetical protein
MRRLGVGFDSAPGALAPIRILLSRAINAYSAPSDPLVGTSSSFLLAIQATGLAFALVRLVLTEYASLPWTH